MYSRLSRARSIPPVVIDLYDKLVRERSEDPLRGASWSELRVSWKVR